MPRRPSCPCAPPPRPPRAPPPRPPRPAPQRPSSPRARPPRPPQPRAPPALLSPCPAIAGPPLHAPRLLCAAAAGDASSSAPAPRRLVLYTKPGCCLCDSLKEKLHAAVLLAGTPYSLASLELQASKPRTTQVVLISMAILFMLFSVQRFGADKVGYTFVPVISVWFLLIAGIEMYNLVVHDIGVLRAFSPMYIVQYFIRNGKSGRVSLGEIILCVTGTEGMFADLGHFNIRVVQVVYLRKFPHNVANTFYRSIPAPMFWPAFIVAILSGIIASQAMLSRAFAILSKALSLSVACQGFE
ncbi:putative high-affinity potassium transporter [Hordeum vulgare]|nr:putative high-affinity potassium transporter [Hordeum vulgare]